MQVGLSRRIVATAAVFSVLPGVAAAQLNPGTVAEASVIVRAGGSFALVLVGGGLVLYRYGAFVDRAIDAVLDRPKVAVFYGLGAFVVVLVGGFYPLSQLSRLGLTGTPLGSASLLLAGVAFVLLGAMGFLVVGTLLTDVYGRRQPWYGLVIGAGLSAVGLLVIPSPVGPFAWVLVAAFGVGGSTRVWFHSERAVRPDTE